MRQSVADPVNLNKFRKAKKRADKEQRAAENRVKFGRTKAEKQLEKASEEKLKNAADAHKLDRPGED